MMPVRTRVEINAPGVRSNFRTQRLTAACRENASMGTSDISHDRKPQERGSSKTGGA